MSLLDLGPVIFGDIDNGSKARICCLDRPHALRVVQSWYYKKEMIQKEV